MKFWQKILFPTLGTVLIFGGYVLYVNKSRENPGVVKKGAEPKPLTKDQLAVVRMLYLTDFKDAKDHLEGKPVWIKAGYSLPYYPYAGAAGSGTVEFAKRVGELPGAAKLDVKKVVKAVAPAKEQNRVPHGDRQYFVVFALDGKPGLFAAPIGFVDAGNETLFTDQLFYYDDPRTIFDHWPQQVWDAVAAHEPRVGMTETQARMAAGILMETDGSSEGNRTVTYHSGPKTWVVTFRNGTATQVKAG